MEKEDTGTGTLRVQVLTANGALPVVGATVRIGSFLPGTDAETLFRTLLTDESGLTPILTLPAPPRAESLTPDTARPFARYRVSVLKAGYYTSADAGTTIFDGIHSLQPIYLVPESMPGAMPGGDRT